MWAGGESRGAHFLRPLCGAAASDMSVNKPRLAWKCASPADTPVGWAGRSQGEAVVVEGEDPTINCKDVTVPRRASGDVGVSSPGTHNLILGPFCAAGSSPSLVSASVMRNSGIEEVVCAYTQAKRRNVGDQLMASAALAVPWGQAVVYRLLR